MKRKDIQSESLEKSKIPADNEYLKTIQHRAKCLMERLDIQRLRELPIEGVAERLGLRVRMHKALCPFHDDHHASLSFKVSRHSFRCFVC